MSELRGLSDQQVGRLEDVCHNIVSNYSISGEYTIKNILQDIPTLIEIKDRLIRLTDLGRDYVKMYKGKKLNNWRNNNSMESVFKDNKLNDACKLTTYRSEYLMDNIKKGQVDDLVYSGCADLIDGIVVKKPQAFIDKYVNKWESYKKSYSKQQCKKALNLTIKLERIDLTDTGDIELLRFDTDQNADITLSLSYIYYGRANVQHLAKSNTEAFEDLMIKAIPVWVCKQLVMSVFQCEDATVCNIFRKCLTKSQEEN